MLSGDVTSSEVTSPDQQMTQLCSPTGVYAYTLNKTVDGDYRLLVQAANNTQLSAQNQIIWSRDSQAPIVSLTTKPSAVQLEQVSLFTFLTDEDATTFECRIDSQIFTACQSPAEYQGLNNGTHSFAVRGRDRAGNIGAPVSFTWSQESYNTLALYHFSSATPFADSSLYSGAEHNDLSNSGSTLEAASTIFGESRRFTASSLQSASASDNNSLDLASSRMTIDLRAKFYTAPTSTAPMTLLGKLGSSGNYGWELRIKRSGSKYVLAFLASTNGSTFTEVKSQAFNLSTGSSAGFYHFAVTWDQGLVKFFIDGSLKGSASIGTAGSSRIFSNTAPLTLGLSANNQYPLNGSLDELRLSQVVRWTSSFTKPTAPYTAD